MANVTKNQEFNKAIKQLQSMVNEKQIISLAEKYYNLKVEMSSLTRAVKEKENALILEEAKSLAAKPEPKVEQKAEEKTAVVFAEPKVEEKRPSAQQQKPTFETDKMTDLKDKTNKVNLILIIEMKEIKMLKTEISINKDRLIQIINQVKTINAQMVNKDHLIQTLSQVKTINVQWQIKTG